MAINSTENSIEKSQEKSGIKITKYSVVAPAKRSGGREMTCSVCAKSYRDNINDDVGEVICATCTMGLADSWHLSKLNRIDYDELLDFVKRGKLISFRKKYGLTRGDISRDLGIHPKFLQRVENSKHYPIDRLVSAIKNKAQLSTPPTGTPSNP